MVKFIQLPVPDPRNVYTEGNVPLAAGYLTAALAVSGIRAAILPREVADRGGDAAVLEWILDDPPEILGFTCFMWNLERSLWLARRVRKAHPRCRIALGGVEMVPDHPLVEEAPVDMVLAGEGEEAFPAWAASAPAAGPMPRWIHAPRVPDLSGLPDPYLSGALVPRRGEILFMETMRGCPYQCQFCLYSKRHAGLRFFPPSRLQALFRLARESEVSEIYLMDPSFNLTPGLKNRLKDLAAWNPGRIPLHSEVRLETMTPPLAAAMARAGFRSVEVGLQSTNPVALAAVSRSWNRERFRRGARLLREQGIRVHTGVILGLPGDGVADFLRSLDFVVDLGLAEDMEIYPLSLLPGTRLRERAAELGIRFQERPPYQVIATPRMGEDELKLAVAAAEDRLGIDFYPPVVPAFFDPPGGFIESLDLRGDTSSAKGFHFPRPSRLANRLSIRLRSTTPAKVLDRAAAWLRESNPHTLLQLVVDEDPLPDDAWCRRLADRFSGAETYFDRLHLYLPAGGLRHSVRLFHLTADPRVLERHLTVPHACDPVFRYTPGILDRVRNLLEEHPLLLIEGPLPRRERRELTLLYRDFPFLMAERSGA